jgi:hypothetical protein
MPIDYYISDSTKLVFHGNYENNTLQDGPLCPQALIMGKNSRWELFGVMTIPVYTLNIESIENIDFMSNKTPDDSLDENASLNQRIEYAKKEFFREDLPFSVIETIPWGKADRYALSRSYTSLFCEKSEYKKMATYATGKLGSRIDSEIAKFYKNVFNTLMNKNLVFAVNIGIESRYFSDLTKKMRPYVNKMGKTKIIPLDFKEDSASDNS